MSELGREIAILLNHPDQWQINQYCLSHNPTGVQLWIASGSFFLDVWDNGKIGGLGLIERHWLWFTKVHPLVKQKKIQPVLSAIKKYKLS